MMLVRVLRAWGTCFGTQQRCQRLFMKNCKEFLAKRRGKRARYICNLTTLYRYKVALESDAAEYGGHKRLDPNCEYFVDSQPWHDRPFSLLVSYVLLTLCSALGLVKRNSCSL